MMLCISSAFAQENKTTYVQKGDLVEATIYHDNGRVEQHGFFKDKKLHGTWTYYNEEGKKVSIGNYENGIKTGKWFFYSQTTLKEVDYDKGRVINVKESENNS